VVQLCVERNPNRPLVGFVARGPNIVSRSIKNAYVDQTGYVHILRADGQDIQVAGEKDQVSADSPVVSPDHQIVGWLVEMPNCCTSYPVPTTLVVYTSGRIVQRINDGMMIYKWAFLDRGRRIAVSSGTVHGNDGDPSDSLQLDNW